MSFVNHEKIIYENNQYSILLFLYFYVGEGQDGVLKKTFKELRQSVATYAAALKRCGVVKGDRVVGMTFLLYFMGLVCLNCLLYIFAYDVNIN